ncbi:hypothetical protein [Mycobacterium kubicae]|uniref:hypothetical protein n=1 Tax=Mycobacterium kubicae TaxID=120959 RepID=UPI0010424BA8|nr:hypothetical protein [Mycobacterium kubicae]
MSSSTARRTWNTRAELATAIFECIEAFYNPVTPAQRPDSVRANRFAHKKVLALLRRCALNRMTASRICFLSNAARAFCTAAATDAVAADGSEIDAFAHCGRDDTWRFGNR